MQKIKKVIHWRIIVPLESILGVLILIVSTVLAANSDMKAAEKEMRTTVEYMKDQCNDSEIRDMASEAKSLLRVTESIEQVRWRLEYGEEARANQAINDQILETYARDSYLDGLLLLDADGRIQAQFDKSGLGSQRVLDLADTDTLMDTLYFQEKTYAIRVEMEDESHVDLAAVSRMDETGIIVGYFYTSAAYARIVNNSIRAIVSGLRSESNGTIVISRGNQIVISNDKSLEGTKVEDTRILKRIMERGTGEKLIHSKDLSDVFGNHFGLMEQSRDYYIYAFMDEEKVFDSTLSRVLSVMFIYVLIIIVTDVLLRKTEQLYRKDQLAVQREYTEKVEAKNRQLESALIQAKKANAAKSNFLSRMSHDVRTPLNGIIGLLKIDEDHFEDKELVRENHKKMQVSANHLLALINDVLQMSKLEDGGVVLAHEVIDLEELTRDIVTIITDRAADAGIVWDYEKGKSEIPYPYIYGSPVHLRQIFLNIYGNCIKYNRPGGKITTIVDVMEEQDGVCTYRWTITDTGIGMEPKFLKHIFEPFTQETNDARSVYNGTGLGMAIVKGLIDQMKGTITVTSEKGTGSVFVITIPFEIAPAPEPAVSQIEAPDDISGLHLLLVEDNELNAEIAEVLLTDEGAEVTMASNGRQAVALFDKYPKGTFDAILMDIMMPVMDGIAATKAIRELQREDAKTIPIIAMTANAFKEDEEKCLAAGMNAHLAKPLDMERVKRTICEQVGRETRG